jgi:hypothetical protein
MTSKLSLIAMLFSCSATASTTPPVIDEFAPPQISMQQAIKKAQQCLRDRNIDLSGYFLQSAEFKRVGPANPYHRSWHLTWDTKRMMRGGQLYVYIAQDGACVVQFSD